MTDGAIPITFFGPPDELQFCDPDIQEAFKNTQYVVGTPTQVQLARNLHNLLLQLQDDAEERRYQRRR